MHVLPLLAHLAQAALPSPALAPAPAPPPVITPAEPGKPASFAMPRDEVRRLGAAASDGEAQRFVPGKGIEFQSKDGRFALAMSLRVGFLYSMKRDGDPPATLHNFEIRRFRTVFSGNLFGAKNKYFLQLAFAPRELDIRDGVVHGTPVYDAYLQFEQLRDLTLRVGQYRVMYTRERNIADVNPLLIDRSLVNAEFNVDRDIGLDIRSEDLGGIKKLRYYAGVYLGEGRDYNNKGSDPGFMYVGRVDVLPLGLFDDYEASDLLRLKQLRISFGGAYAFHDRARKDRGVLGTAPLDGGTTNYHNTTADVMLKYAGWSLEAAYMWRRGRRNPGAAVDELGAPIAAAAARNGHGWLAQTAVLIPRTRLEPALRYSGTRGLGITTMPNRDELGGGLNYYFFGHNLKLQVDYFHSFDPAGMAPAGDLLRLQIQAAL
jgi:phosphate-selective porin OprO/OprP